MTKLPLRLVPMLALPAFCMAAEGNSKPLDIRLVLAGGQTLNYESDIDYTSGSNSLFSTQSLTYEADDPKGPARISLAVYRPVTNGNVPLIFSAGLEYEKFDDEGLDNIFLLGRIGCGTRITAGDEFFFDFLGSLRFGSVAFEDSDVTLSSEIDDATGSGTLFGFGLEACAMWELKLFQIGLQARLDFSGIAGDIEFDRTGGSYEVTTSYSTATIGLVLGYRL